MRNDWPVAPTDRHRRFSAKTWTKFRFAARVIAALALGAPRWARVVIIEAHSPPETDSSVVIVAAGSVGHAVSTADPGGTNPGYGKQSCR